MPKIPRRAAPSDLPAVVVEYPPSPPPVMPATRPAFSKRPHDYGYARPEGELLIERRGTLIHMHSFSPCEDRTVQVRFPVTYDDPSLAGAHVTGAVFGERAADLWVELAHPITGSRVTCIVPRLICTG